jgi:hypothetical protein
VRVYYGAQSDHQEWQWRDRYSASNDRPYLSIHGLGAITVIENDDNVEIKIELKNRNDSSRSATFIFEKKEVVPVRTLSADEQAKFLATVQSEQQRIMAELERMWGFKSPMVATGPGWPSGYQPYQRPRMKQIEVKAEIGVAAFITEEQIDHRVDDPQMRFEMYVVTAGDEKAECKAEDHGYVREGGAFLTILEVTADTVTINTKTGKRTISLTKKQ